jgi:hypothetical protein
MGTVSPQHPVTSPSEARMIPMTPKAVGHEVGWPSSGTLPRSDGGGTSDICIVDTSGGATAGRTGN